MRIRSGIPEVDRLEDERATPSPGLAASLDEVPTDAEALTISRKTRRLAALTERPFLRRIIAKGVGEKELEHIGRVAGLEQLALTATTSRDLRTLAGLSQLRILSVSVSSRLESLDGIATLANLQMVSTWHTPKLTSIEALASLRQLRIVFLSGAMYKPMRLPSLRPLSELEHLTKLHLSSVRVADGSLEPLSRLTRLRRLDLPLTFRRGEFEMLERVLPNAQGRWRLQWRHFARHS
ncbi:MAG TPA: hypothetical protein VF785_15925 [Gemmatimonadaceae bacterium]